jgi:hypothetical protein
LCAKVGRFCASMMRSLHERSVGWVPKNARPLLGLMR